MNDLRALLKDTFSVVVIVAAILTMGLLCASLLISPPISGWFLLAALMLLTGIISLTLHKAIKDSTTTQQQLRELGRCQAETQRVYDLLKTTRLRLYEAEQTAKKANDLKTRFISNLSHELRTPLTAIINFSYILAQTPPQDITYEQQLDYLTRIYQAGEFLREMANDLLDLAKIEAGQMELFCEPLELLPVCTSTMNTVAGLIEDKPIELRQDIPTNLPLIYADKMRVQQILLNLLGNAVKYTNEGHITLQIGENNGKLKVSVIDTGIGIKKQDFERIFEEFQQTEEAFALRKPGAGLGLPISRKFVELHGGELWLESEVGQGSAFHFTLPIATPSLNGIEAGVQIANSPVQTETAA